MIGKAVRSTTYSRPSLTRLVVLAILALITILLVSLAALTAPSRAYAAESTVDVGVADSFSVLGGQTVTNTGPSVLDGEVGVAPGTAITGFPPGVATVEHRADAEALAAQAAVTTAYNDAAGRASNALITADLGGQTLVAGVYTASSSAGLTGPLTLDGQDDPDSVFIFQIGSTLTTAPDSSVLLINGAQPCNVFWQIGSSATLDVRTTFVGTVLALTSITVNTDATVDGRALARNGSVTLDTNTFRSSACIAPSPSPTPTATDTPTPVVTPTETGSATESVTPTETGSATESATETQSESATESVTPTETGSATETQSESATESATETQSESATESVTPTETGSATETQSESATESATETQSESATESTTGAVTGSGDSLAGTGASRLTSLLTFGGLGLLLLGGVLVATRLLSRPKGRH